MSSADSRSVGELLVDNDLVARRLLMDADMADPRALIRSWGEVVESAVDLWSSLPPRNLGREDPRQGTIDQLSLATRQTVRRSWGTLWPGPGGGDPHLTEMASNFDRAADLIQRLHERPKGTRMRDAAVADVEASRLRVMHSLYLVSHAMGRTLARELTGFDDRAASRERKHAPETIGRFREHADSVEQLLGWEVAREWPAALRGEHHDPVENSRLAVRWAAWELQAQRALAHSPTTATLAAISDGQAVSLAGGNNLARAAALLDHIDPTEYRDRIAPVLEATVGQWRAAAQMWRSLSPQGMRGVDSDLLLANRELRAAQVEIQRDRAVLATPATMAERVDLAEAVRAVHRAVIGSVDVARSVQDVSKDAPLVASARSLHRATQAAADRQHADHLDTSPHATWISPNDIHRNTEVPLPGLLREDLAQRMGEVIAVGETARGAASSMHRASQPAAEPSMVGRQAEERRVPSTAAARSPRPAR